MNIFLIILLVAIGLLFVYESIMLVRAIIKRHKNKDNSTQKSHNQKPLRKE